MTYEEKLMLNDFLGKLVSVNNIAKDPEADMMIKKAMSAQPDAGYVLVQNMLLMQAALTQLQARVEELERARETNAQSSQSTFLGANAQSAVHSYFGGQQKQQPQAQPAYQQQSSQPYGAQNTQQQGMRQSSGMGDFLRSAGTTAAGVAGGMLLFEGINSLFSPHSSGAFGGGMGMPQETTINNYYGDSASSDTTPSDDGFLSDGDIDSAFGGDFGGDDSF